MTLTPLEVIVTAEPTTTDPPVTLTPARAVTIPIESTLVTSSYVRVPAILTLPLTDTLLAVTTPTVTLGVPLNPKEVADAVAVDAVPVKFPTKLLAVTEPLAFTAPKTVKSPTVDIPTPPTNCAFVCDIIGLIVLLLI